MVTNILCDKMKSDFCPSDYSEVYFFGSSSLDLKSCHANNSVLFSKIILLTSPHLLRPPDFAWPATLRRVPSGGVAATTTSLRFINEIFIPPRGLIIHRYNPESDIRQSPWNNHFPFAHNTLIIHVFSARRSLRPLCLVSFLHLPSSLFPRNCDQLSTWRRSDAAAAVASSDHAD